MRSRPKIDIRRAVEVYEEMVGCRRLGYEDGDFFKMSDVLETLCNSENYTGKAEWSVKTFRTNPAEDFARKVGVVEFDGSVIFSMDERFLESARKGCGLSNFILAHELGHVGLQHHARNAVVKNFQLFSGPNGMSNIPPTVEELEANYAAVFFQCGVALGDDKWGTIDLAKLAYSDIPYVRKAQKMVRLPAFQQILKDPIRKSPRVIL